MTAPLFCPLELSENASILEAYPERLFHIGEKRMRSKNTELMTHIKEYIERYFDRYSSTPTVREIAGSMHIATSSAHRYLVAMAERNMITYYPNLIFLIYQMKIRLQIYTRMFIINACHVWAH